MTNEEIEMLEKLARGSMSEPMEKINPYENKPGTHWERSCFDRGFRQGARAGYLKAIEVLREQMIKVASMKFGNADGFANLLESRIDEVLK